ncbi:histone-lysine N-methyltransferase SETMAR-like [Mercenaria mercenaria]|uniref:histone-lysine N-methyltransferase SETMAR-like n=1 Tax=Mercenaria mercenaria TaxID=6596 RepID=UPI00234E9208|nr:histone-lysine N-methyltransferase SETMAR-like [Mercenaria mercenaria]
MAEDQRFAIKFLVLKRKSKNEVVREIKSTFGDSSMSKTRIYVWYDRFNNGWENAYDLPRSGWKVTSTHDKNVTRVKDLINSDRQLTVREICNKLNLSYGTVHTILKKKLNMRKVAARLIPKLLNCEQKKMRIEAARNFLHKYHALGEAFINSIVTVDETRIPLYNPETKQDSCIWKTPASPSPQKAKVLSRHFLRAMRWKHPEKLNHFILHHDNEPPHTSKVTTSHIEHLGINLLDHPPYSPNLSPNDFYLFPTLKRELRGLKMNSFSELRKKVLNVLNEIPKDDYRNSLLSWGKFENHHQLTHKLDTLGVYPLASQWIKSFLNERSQRVPVVVDGFTSDELPILSGVPQGSVIGPKTVVFS